MAVTRITGMASGFDTDQMVKDLLKIEQMKVDRVKAKKQITTWKQDQYRDIIKAMQDLQSNYFDVLKGNQNISSATSFAKFSSLITSGGAENKAVSVIGTADAGSLNYTINSITQLATKDKYTSDEIGLNQINSGTLDFASIPANMKFNLTIDGVTKTIDFDTSTLATQDAAGLADKLNSEISASFGADYSDVVSVSGTSIKFEKTGSEIAILEDTSSPETMTFLGVASGASTSSYRGESLNSLLGISDADLANMTINGKSLSQLGVTQDSTIEEMENIVNSSSVGAKIRYSSLNDTFEITSDKEGTLNALTLSDDFKSNLKLSDVNHEAAQNAKLNIDGQDVIKSSNTFTLNGVQFTLNSTYTDPDPIDITLNRDKEAVMENIKNFVAEYNKIVDMVSGKLDEKVYRTYQPLTEEERKDLSDNEVELWDEKAKSGHLRSDPALRKMLSDMRLAIYSSVENAGIGITDIGITTSPNYKDNGKLVINETKLEKALDENFDSVVSLFTNESDKKYLDSANRKERYDENGIGNRLLDIIKDNVRITRDDDGKKGILIEKAGVPGDTNPASNDLSKEISDIDDRIEILLDYLQNKETIYYNKFAAMEKALAEMQNQSASLMGQMG